MPSVEVNLPNVPQGAKVSVPYLGKFTNGETAEVSDKAWGRYLRNQPGAKETGDGTLRLTREAFKEAAETPSGADPENSSPEVEDLTSDDVETKLNNPNQEV